MHESNPIVMHRDLKPANIVLVGMPQHSPYSLDAWSVCVCVCVSVSLSLCVRV